MALADYEQIIFHALDTTLQTEHNEIQLRVTRNSRYPLLTRARGAWNSTDLFETNDEVVGSGRVYWRALRDNTNVTPTEGADWTESNRWYWAHPDPSKVLILDPGLRLQVFGGMGSLSRHMSLEDAKVTPDHREVMFRDFTSYSGVDGVGNPVSGDMMSEGSQSFFTTIFDNPEALATFSMNRILNGAATYDDKTAYEMYWMGDANCGLITDEDFVNLAERSRVAFQPSQTWHIPIDSISRRGESMVAKDLFGLVEDSDLSERAFYGGYAPRSLSTGIGPAEPAYKHNEILSEETKLSFTFFGRATSAVVTIDSRLHFILKSRFLSYLAAALGCLFDEALDIVTGVRLWTDYDDNASGGIKTRELLPPTDPGNIYQTVGRAFEYLLNSDPRCERGVQEMETSCGYSWDTQLSTILEKECRGLIARTEWTYDQTLKKPRLRFIDLRALNTAPGSRLDTMSGAGAGVLSVDNVNDVKHGRNPPFFAQLTDGRRVETVEITSDNLVNLLFLADPLSQDWDVESRIEAVRLIPERWKAAGKPTKSQRRVSAKTVEVTTKGYDDKLSCPRRTTPRSTALSIEMPDAVKRLGPLGGVPTMKDLTYNSKIDYFDNLSCWQVFSGGTQNGRHIHATDATITDLGGSGVGSFHDYQLTSLSSDFSYLRTDYFGDQVDYAPGWDYILFANGSFGQITDVGRNTLYYVTDSAYSPPTGPGVPFLIGYTGWISGITLTSNSDTFISTGNLSSTDQFGNNFIGQQIIFPKRGVFRIKNCVLDHTVGSTDYYETTLDRFVEIGGVGLDGWVGGPDLNPNGAVAGGFLYYDNTTDHRFTGSGNKWFPNKWGTHAYLGSPDAVDIAGVSRGQFDTFNYYQWYQDDNTFGPNTYQRYPFTPWHGSATTMPDIFAGAYTVSRMTYGVTVPNENHGNATYAASQVYASLYIGNFSTHSRSYVGGVSNSSMSGVRDGTLVDWGNGDSLVEFRNGKVRCYQMIGNELNEFEKGGGSVSMDLTEWPDFSRDLNDGRFKVHGSNNNNATGSTSTVGAAGSSGSGNSNGGGGGTTTDLGAALLVRPNSSHRNRAQATTTGVAPLEAQLLTGSTDDLLTLYASDGTTPLAGVTHLGGLFGATLTGTNMSTGLVHSDSAGNLSSVALTNGQIIIGRTGLAAVAATLTAGTGISITNGSGTITIAVDPSTITGVVVTSPSGGTGNEVLALDNSTVPLSLRAKSGSLQNIFNIKNAAGSVVAAIDYQFSFGTNGAISAGLEVSSASTSSSSAGTVCITKDHAVTSTPGGGWTNVIQATDTSTVPMDVWRFSTSTQNLTNWRNNSGTVIANVDSAGFASFQGISANSSTAGVTVTTTGSAVSLSITSSTSSGNIVSIADGSSNQIFAISNNKSATFGTGANVNLKASALATNQIQQDTRTFTTGTYTLDGTHANVEGNTAGGNVTFSLPAHSTSIGYSVMVAKGAAANSLIVNEVGGGGLKTWTANGETHFFTATSSGYKIQ